MYGVMYNPYLYNLYLLHNYAMMCIFLHTGQSVISVTSLQCDASLFCKTSQFMSHRLEDSSPKWRSRILVLERKI